MLFILLTFLECSSEVFLDMIWEVAELFENLVELFLAVFFLSNVLKVWAVVFDWEDLNAVSLVV